MALKRKQKALIEALNKTLGSITKSCKAVEISRNTYYQWLKQPEFAEAVRDLPEIRIDVIEDCLLKNAIEGNVTAQIFFLKAQAKHRGYVEKQEIENTYKGESFKLIIEQPNENNKMDTKQKTTGSV